MDEKNTQDEALRKLIEEYPEERELLEKFGDRETCVDILRICYAFAVLGSLVNGACAGAALAAEGCKSPRVNTDQYSGTVRLLTPHLNKMRATLRGDMEGVAKLLNQMSPALTVLSSMLLEVTNGAMRRLFSDEAFRTVLARTIDAGRIPEGPAVQSPLDKSKN